MKICYEDLWLRKINWFVPKTSFVGIQDATCLPSKSKPWIMVDN